MGIGKDTDNRDEITEEFAQLKNPLTSTRQALMILTYCLLV